MVLYSTYFVVCRVSHKHRKSYRGICSGVGINCIRAPSRERPNVVPVTLHRQPRAPQLWDNANYVNPHANYVILHANYVNPHANYVNPNANYVNPNANYVLLHRALSHINFSVGGASAQAPFTVTTLCTVDLSNHITPAGKVCDDEMDTSTAIFSIYCPETGTANERFRRESLPNDSISFDH